jgi:hypothetical protein
MQSLPFSGRQMAFWRRTEHPGGGMTEEEKRKLSAQEDAETAERRAVAREADRAAAKAKGTKTRLIYAVLAMAVAVVCLFALDAMRPAPATLSAEVQARKALASAEVQASMAEKSAGIELPIELRRKTANALLEIAILAEKSSKTGSPAERMQRLQKAQQEILSTYSTGRQSANEKLETKKTALESSNKKSSTATAGSEIQLTAQSVDKTEADLLEDRIASLERKAAPESKFQKLLNRFVDADSSLNLVYKATILGLIGVFTVGGLTLLLILAEKTGLKRESTPDLGSGREKPSAGALPQLPFRYAVPIGTATTAGIAAVGTAVAMTFAGPADAMKPHAQSNDSSAISSYAFQQTKNTVNNSNGNLEQPVEVKLAQPLPNVAVDITASPSWVSSTTALTTGTAKLADTAVQLNTSTKNMAQLSTELRSIADVLKTQPGSARRVDLEELAKQTKKLAEQTDKLREDSNKANQRFHGLAVQVLRNDCYARRSNALIVKSAILLGSMPETSPRIISGDCNIPIEDQAAPGAQTIQIAAKGE